MTLQLSLKEFLIGQTPRSSKQIRDLEDELGIELFRRIPAKDVIFRDLTPEDRAMMPVAAAWKRDGVTAAVASQFVDVLTQTVEPEMGRAEPVWSLTHWCTISGDFVSFFVSTAAICKANRKPSKRVWENPMDVD